MNAKPKLKHLPRKCIAAMSRKKQPSADGIPVWCDHVKLVNPGELADFPGNPNKHSEEQLRRIIGIIRRNGWRDAIVVSRLTGRITKGHGRKQAAILAGWASVPVEYQDYETEADERRDVIADNRAREGAELDEQELSAVLSSLAEEDLGGAGFTPAELRSLTGPSPRAGVKKWSAGKAAPAMTWVLLGIKTLEYGRIAPTIAALSSTVEVCEVSANDKES